MVNMKPFLFTVGSVIENHPSIFYCLSLRITEAWCFSPAFICCTPQTGHQSGTYKHSDIQPSAHQFRTISQPNSDVFGQWNSEMCEPYTDRPGIRVLPETGQTAPLCTGESHSWKPFINQTDLEYILNSF